MTSRTTDPHGLQQLDGELFFARRLVNYGYRVHEGDASADVKRERIRNAIIDCHLDNVIVSRNGEENYSQAFERFYGEPLHRKPKGII